MTNNFQSHGKPEPESKILAGLNSGLQPEEDTAEAADVPSNSAATLQPDELSLETVAEIATCRDILGLFVSDLVATGVVGEERLARILYLALTSRLFRSPVSVAVKGPSSGGKSFSVERVLSFFPKEAYYELSAMSEKALVYLDEPLQHRFLVMFEAAGMKGDFIEYLIRTLLSEGRLRYQTVEKTEGGALAPRTIEREGPTGLITTTTLASLHPENETRYVSVSVADTPEQTAQILRALASEQEAGAGVDLDQWQLFQSWLAKDPPEVSIPFAGMLAEQVLPVGVRLRRDFAKVLTLIKAHALIHQATRNRDGKGRIKADLRDYRVVRELVNDLISEGLGASVSSTVRETVNAVAKLSKNDSAGPYGQPLGVSVAEVAEELRLDKSAALRRVRVAQQSRYLENLEPRRGNRARLVLGDPLPGERTILPTVEKLMVALVNDAKDRTAAANRHDGGQAS